MPKENLLHCGDGAVTASNELSLGRSPSHSLETFQTHLDVSLCHLDPALALLGLDDVQRSLSSPAPLGFPDSQAGRDRKEPPASNSATPAQLQIHFCQELQVTPGLGN